MVTRATAASFIGMAVLAAACTNSPAEKKGGDKKVEGSACALTSAEGARQTLITTRGFTPSCVKIKEGQQFFFINDDAKVRHTATTATGSPTSFDADLAMKNSTYTQVFKTRGTYAIKDKTSSKTMTLIVY